VYATTATPTAENVLRPRAAAFVAALPVEAWSPGLRRTVRISDQQRRLLVILAHRPAQRLRSLSVESGYHDAAGVSRALRTLERLGMIGRSSTRGRNGSTVAWIRAGAGMMRPLAELMRAALTAVRAANVSTLTDRRTTPRVRTEGVDTFSADRPAPAGQRRVSDAMRAARALLDPRHYPAQHRPAADDVTDDGRAV
jgi:hypothetical protein